MEPNEIEIILIESSIFALHFLGTKEHFLTDKPSF